MLCMRTWSDLQDVTGTNVILIPIGCCDDGAHSQNEKIDVLNYIEGVSFASSYLGSPMGLET